MLPSKLRYTTREIAFLFFGESAKAFAASQLGITQYTRVNKAKENIRGLS